MVAGAGRAIVGRSTVVLKPRTLLLIPEGGPRIRSRIHLAALVTLNFYVPPAYRSSGEVRPAIGNMPRLTTARQHYPPGILRNTLFCLVLVSSMVSGGALNVERGYDYGPFSRAMGNVRGCT